MGRTLSVGPRPEPRARSWVLPVARVVGGHGRHGDEAAPVGPCAARDHEQGGVHRLYRHAVNVLGRYCRYPLDQLFSGVSQAICGRHHPVGGGYRTGCRLAAGRSVGGYELDDRVQTAIWVREVNPSLFRMFRTWASTVRSEMNSRAPICLLLRPSAIRHATCVSRMPSGPASSSATVPLVVGSPSANAIAVSRSRRRPASYSARKAAVPSAALADCSARAGSGTRNGIRSPPVPVRMVSAAASSRAARLGCPVPAEWQASVLRK